MYFIVNLSHVELGFKQVMLKAHSPSDAAERVAKEHPQWTVTHANYLLKKVP